MNLFCGICGKGEVKYSCWDNDKNKEIPVCEQCHFRYPYRYSSGSSSGEDSKINDAGKGENSCDSLEPYAINDIHCCDCVSAMKKMKMASVDLTITSPPYNLGTRGDDNLYDEYEDDLLSNDYYKFIRSSLDEMLRVTRNYVFFNFQLLSNNKKAYLQIISDFRDKIKDIVIWSKPSAIPAPKGAFTNNYEFILCMSRTDNRGKKFRYINEKSWDKRGVVRNTLDMHNVNKFADVHKAVFPEGLPYFFIDLFSKEGDLILDPFSGTGTTAIVAKKMGRNFIGFDISEEYVSLSKKRLNSTSKETEKLTGLRPFF